MEGVKVDEAVGENDCDSMSVEERDGDRVRREYVNEIW